jgi:hypothetical protein
VGRTYVKLAVRIVTTEPTAGPPNTAAPLLPSYYSMLLSCPTIQLSTITVSPNSPYCPPSHIRPMQCYNKVTRPSPERPARSTLSQCLPPHLPTRTPIFTQNVCSSNSAVDILQLLAGCPIGRGSCAVLTVLFITSAASTSALGSIQ